MSGYGCSCNMHDVEIPCWFFGKESGWSIEAWSTFLVLCLVQTIRGMGQPNVNH